mgnify:CR=1 FL=1
MEVIWDELQGDGDKQAFYELIEGLHQEMMKRLDSVEILDVFQRSGRTFAWWLAF